jgi:hypothetical protein
MNKDNFNRIAFIVLIFVIIFMSWKISLTQQDLLNLSDDVKKSIIASDKLTKEANGQYAKIVDYYKSQEDLISELRSTNLELYKKVRGQDERLLSITNAIITLDKKVVSGFAKRDPLDTNQLNLSLKYPTEKDPFVFWDGWVNKNTAAYRGEFSFSKLPIKIVLTEESRGTWKSRLIGPTWLKVDSLTISSIPPKDYPTIIQNKVQWLVGGSYIKTLNNTGDAIGLNFGVNLYDVHNIILGANTLQQISFGYTYKLKSFKKK